MELSDRHGVNPPTDGVTSQRPAADVRFRDATATLPSDPTAPARARVLASGWLAGDVDDAVLRDALLILSELVSNSVLHAGAEPGDGVRVSAALTADRLRLEVGDGGHDGGVVRRPPQAMVGGGFGLNLVEEIAERWGVTHAAGTQVWVELDLNGG